MKRSINEVNLQNVTMKLRMNFIKKFINILKIYFYVTSIVYGVDVRECKRKIKFNDGHKFHLFINFQWYNTIEGSTRLVPQE